MFKLAIKSCLDLLSEKSFQNVPDLSVFPWEDDNSAVQWSWFITGRLAEEISVLRGTDESEKVMNDSASNHFDS